MHLDDLIAFLAGSPSPWHVVATASERLSAAGFEAVDLAQAWSAAPARGFVVRGAAMVAWKQASPTDGTSPLRLLLSMSPKLNCIDHIRYRPIATIGKRRMA